MTQYISMLKESILPLNMVSKHVFLQESLSTTGLLGVHIMLLTTPVTKIDNSKVS